MKQITKYRRIPLYHYFPEESNITRFKSLHLKKHVYLYFFYLFLIYIYKNNLILSFKKKLLLWNLRKLRRNRVSLAIKKRFLFILFLKTQVLSLRSKKFSTFLSGYSSFFNSLFTKYSFDSRLEADHLFKKQKKIIFLLSKLKNELPIKDSLSFFSFLKTSTLFSLSSQYQLSNIRYDYENYNKNTLLYLNINNIANLTSFDRYKLLKKTIIFFNN